MESYVGNGGWLQKLDFLGGLSEDGELLELGLELLVKVGMDLGEESVEVLLGDVILKGTDGDGRPSVEPAVNWNVERLREGECRWLYPQVGREGNHDQS